MSSCIFCRIIAGEIPAEVVARNAHVVAFLDVQPLADGHVLVVPVAHEATVEDLEPAQADALFRAVVQLAGPVREALDAAGTTIGVNNGEATGQTIPHVHVHIVPRWPNDGAGTVHTIFPRKTSRDIKEVGTAIRREVAERSAGIDVARGAD
jgi:histidine triad (HIT) family protein